MLPSAIGPVLLFAASAAGTAPFEGVAREAPPGSIAHAVRHGAPPLVHRRANSFTLSGQQEASLDADESGAIVAAWTSRRQRGGHSAVVMRWFDANGHPLGDELVMAAGEEGAERAAAVALDGAGAAWIAWVLEGLVDGRATIMASRIDPWSDAPRAAPARLGDGLGSSDAPVVVALPDGGAVVAWVERATDEGTGTIMVQALDRLGHPRGEARPADPASPWGQTPSVATLPCGAVLLAWGACDRDGEPQGVKMVRLSPEGAVLGPVEELDLGPVTGAAALGPLFAIEPSLGPSAHGAAGPVLAWMQGTDAGYAVMAVPLDAHGCPETPGVLVAESSAADDEGVDGRRRWLSGAAAARQRDGRLAVAWTEQDAVGDPVARMLFVDPRAPEDREAVPTIGSEGLDGRMTKGALRPASGARRLALHMGQPLFAWHGDAGLGDRSAVHLALAAADPASPASLAQAASAKAAAPASDDDAGADRAEPHEPPTYDPRLVEAPNQAREPVLAGSGEVVGFLGFNNSGWTPPDPSLAVGPNHLMGIVNGHIALYSKSGAVLLDQDIEGSGGFWGSVGATNFVFDPEAVYDPVHDRFWAMASEGNVGAKSYILLAVSKTSDPAADGFHRYRIDTTPWGSQVFDSPNICVGADAVYVSGDPNSGAYPICVLPVAPLLAGGPAVIANVPLLTTSTQSAGIPPVKPADCPALYLVEHQETNPATGVRLIAMADGLGTPAFSSVVIPVESYTPPEDAPQKGTSVRPESFDARFWSVAWRSAPEDGPGAGALWATHHVNSTRVRARWYEFRTNGWPFSGSQPTLAQWGEIDPGGTVRTSFSAIGVDEEGNASIVCARSSPTEFISMITARRAAGDPPGTFRAPTTEQVSTAGDTSGRWGDYAAVRPDPAEPPVFWAHHEYRTSSWKTWIARRRLALADINMDGTVDAADLGLLLSLWGDGVNSPADLDGNGIVDAADLGALLAEWE